MEQREEKCTAPEEQVLTQLKEEQMKTIVC